MSRFIDGSAEKQDRLNYYAGLAVECYSRTSGVIATCTGTETLSVLELAVRFGYSDCITEDDYDGWDWVNQDPWGGDRPTHPPKIS
jgi:hypothetical protein